MAAFRVPVARQRCRESYKSIEWHKRIPVARKWCDRCLCISTRFWHNKAQVFVAYSIYIFNIFRYELSKQVRHKFSWPSVNLETIAIVCWGTWNLGKQCDILQILLELSVVDVESWLDNVKMPRSDWAARPARWASPEPSHRRKYKSSFVTADCRWSISPIVSVASFRPCRLLFCTGENALIPWIRVLCIGQPQSLSRNCDLTVIISLGRNEV